MSRFLPVLTLLILTQQPVVAEVSDIVRSSEKTAVSLCLQNQRPYGELILLCQDALDQSVLTRNQRRHARYVLGNALSELGQHAKARVTLERLIAEFPNHIDALEALAWDYWQTDDHELAKLKFEQVNQIQPTAEAMAGLANIARRFENDLERAVPLIEFAVLIDPDYSWAQREKAWIEFDTGDLTSAAASFDTALRQNDEDISALHGRSYVASETEEFEAALLFINRAIELDSNYGWAYAHRGYVLRQMGRNGQAVREAERAIQLAPGAVDGYLQKMLAHRELGQIAEALNTATLAQEAGATTALLRYWHADILSDDAQMPKALTEIETAIDAGADTASFHELKSFILLEMGKHVQAVEASRSALNRDPKLPFAAYYGAMASIELGQQDQGFELFDRALENDLPKPQFRYFLGFLVGKGLITKAVGIREKNSQFSAP